jgi:hypothetical protein
MPETNWPRGTALQMACTATYYRNRTVRLAASISTAREYRERQSSADLLPALHGKVSPVTLCVIRAPAHGKATIRAVFGQRSIDHLRGQSASRG